MKTSELQGAALDWAVAKCEGLDSAWGMWVEDDLFIGLPYSTDWGYGGPIIEREGIRTSDEPFKDGDECFVSEGVGHWYASHSTWRFTNLKGQTPLIAAMRCYVASKLGNEIEVPNELKGE